MKKIIILLFFLLSCTEKPQVEGLWELHEFSVDMYGRGFKPTYIKFDNNGSFSVSKEDGDIAGLYRLDESLLSLSSNDQKWFNRNWEVITTENELILNDVRNSFRGVQMRFNKIDKFPSFEEFWSDSMERGSSIRSWKKEKTVE